MSVIQDDISTNPLIVALQEKRVLLGDGANGTWLGLKGFDRLPYDLANVLDPDLVREVHREYSEAGADVIETNTFSANAIRLGVMNYDIAEINRNGARLAREGAPDKVILGAIGPCGKPLAPIGAIEVEQAFEVFAEQAAALVDGGVDGFLLETFIDLEELAIAVRAVQSVTNLPIIVSKAFIEDGDALIEGLPSRCCAEMELSGVVAIGANCVVGPQRMTDIIRQLAESGSLPVLAMPTPGLPQLVKGKIVYDVAPDYFARSAVRLIEEGARIVGGCCGTTPEHIRQMREVIDSGNIKHKHPSHSARRAAEKEPLIQTEPTELGEKLAAGRFITTVEIDLPRGLKVENVIKGSRHLKILGVDLIDISDGARARLRMNPLSVCKLIQDEVGIETMMHFACRDRNLLAVQADLLCAHAMGVRNILAITGDPANIGDYPSATSVYDVDAIGLVRILNRFNEGIDLAGYSVGVKCAFTIAIAFNPLAPDLDSEMDRLNRKVQAGAHLIYTQPLFEESQIEKALELTQRTSLPLFVGVLPLKNGRHTEFMHNEVPGIEISDRLRQRMLGAATDEDALQIGIEEAQNQIVAARRMARGVYLMPPFGSTAIASQVLGAIL